MSKDFLSQPNGIQYFDQLRCFFESSLVRYAAEFATDEQIEELAKALELNGKAIHSDSQFKKTDIYFHRVIASIPNNPIFLSIHQALVDWVIDSRPVITNESELNAKSHQDHVELFEFIKNKDVEGADKKLTQHLEYVFENYYS